MAEERGMYMQTNTPLELFRQAASGISNPALEAWTRDGGKVIGLYYSYIPEELFTAANIMPYRIRATGADGMERSDAYFSSINCSFVRNQLHEAIGGAYDFLDAVAATNMCDHVRRAYDNWERLVDKSGKHFYFVTVPQKQGQAQSAYLTEQLRQLKKQIEIDFDVQITDEKLNAAIILHNEIRTLWRRLYELRKETNLVVSGSDVLAAMIAGESMPKTIYKDLLTSWIQELEANKTIKAGKRLMIVGGDCDSVVLYDLIESLGACIVTDMQWNGLRSAIKDVPITDDPLCALANYQLNIRPQDPRTVGLCFERYEQIKEIGEAAGVDGYVHLRIPMCDMYSFDQDDFAAWCKTKDMPVLKLEAEYLPEGFGQIKTRIQAFLETM